MSLSSNSSAVVAGGAQTINISSLFTVTGGASDPAYLILSAYDRDEYPAGSTCATGQFSGNGAVAGLTHIDDDGRAAGIVFTYQASLGRYYNTTYGFLDQMTYAASSSPNDVTSLSLFGTDSLSFANNYAHDPVVLLEIDFDGYYGSVTVATQPAFIGPVPSQATPNSIVAVAQTFVGKAWNLDGCWTLAMTIAAEAGASLPVHSTEIGVPGQGNGEWFVAFNGPAGQSANWQSLVKAGEMVVFENADGQSGHITTCVSGAGSTAMLIDNITYVDNHGQIVNSANDGNSNDVFVSAAHAASAEFSGVGEGTVVIYELDTPAVRSLLSALSLGKNVSETLSAAFTAADPAGKAVTQYQVYNSAATDLLTVNGTAVQANSAAAAVTTASLSSVCLIGGSTACTDTIEVRAYNGSYWGDWQTLSVTATGIAVAQPPVVASQTPAQTWSQGQTLSFTLPAGTFTDPQNQTLTYAAKLSNGQALPSWLHFNAATETFSGTVPTGVQNLSVTVTATDTSGLAVSESFAVTVPAMAPVLAAATPNQTWLAGHAVSLVLPAGTFIDPQNQALTYTAKLSNGQALPSWLHFNATSKSFSGTAPITAQSLSLTVTATDTGGLSASESFSVAVPTPPIVAIATPSQTWSQGQAASLALPTGTFTDPQGQALTYAAKLSNGQALPSWLHFNAATETFSGTVPTSAQNLSVIVTATDTSGLSVSENFAITIPAIPPVVAIATPNQTWLAGHAVSLALPAGTFTDPQGQALTYTAKLSNGQALPSWLHFNATSKAFSGTAPITAQSLSLSVTATDTSGLSASESFAVTVTTPSPPPVLAHQTPAQTWSQGQTVSFSLPAGTFTDPLGQTLTYAAKLTNGQALPNWLHFNATTEIFSGTVPTGVQNLSVTVTATDTGGLAASESFAMTVPAAPPVVAIATPNQTWLTGHSVSLALSAGTFTDPQGQTLTYAAKLSNGQALPSWLHFNAAHDSFTGTPPSSAAGTLGIAVTAHDASGLTVTDSFNVTIGTTLAGIVHAPASGFMLF